MRKIRNITVAIEENVYRQIQVWCALRDVSISHVVQTFLNDLPHMDNVRRFPTPAAPDSGSLGEQFDQLDFRQLELLRYVSRNSLPNFK